MKTCGIYRILNKENGHFYIGQSSDLSHRKSVHWCKLRKNDRFNRYLQNAWNKYGEDAFVFEIILLCEARELLYYEQSLVDRLKPQYNIKLKCVSSPLGIKLSSETRQKMSKSRIGVKNPNFGKHHSPETLRKISIANTGRHPSAETLLKFSKTRSGKNNSRFGVHLSDELKKRISESEKGKTISAEHKKRVSEAHLGKPLSEEHRKKIGAANKGRKHSEESRQKMSLSHMGQKAWNAGKHKNKKAGEPLLQLELPLELAS